MEIQTAVEQLTRQTETQSDLVSDDTVTRTRQHTSIVPAHANQRHAHKTPSRLKRFASEEQFGIGWLIYTDRNYYLYVTTFLSQ